MRASTPYREQACKRVHARTPAPLVPRALLAGVDEFIAWTLRERRAEELRGWGHIARCLEPDERVRFAAQLLEEVRAGTRNLSPSPSARTDAWLSMLFPNGVAP